MLLVQFVWQMMYHCSTFSYRLRHHNMKTNGSRYVINMMIYTEVWESYYSSECIYLHPTMYRVYAANRVNYYEPINKEQLIPNQLLSAHSLCCIHIWLYKDKPSVVAWWSVEERG